MNSRWLSMILRHHPESIGLKLDAQGWAPIDTLLRCATQHNKALSREMLLQIVANCPKKRFTLSADGQKIRAAQGHSIQGLQLEYEAKIPPVALYHGTAKRFVSAILAQGLLPMGRQYVHLSAEIETARMVGARHGKPIIFQIDTQTLSEQGHLFYQADNGVWLSGAIEPQFISILT